MKKILIAMIASLSVLTAAACSCAPETAVSSVSRDESANVPDDKSETSSDTSQQTGEVSDPSSEEAPDANSGSSDAVSSPEPTVSAAPDAPEESGPKEITYFLFNCDSISDWRVRAALTISIDRSVYPSPSYGIVADGVSDSSGYNFEDGAPSPGNIYGVLKMMYPDYDFSDYASCCSAAQALYMSAVNEGVFDPASELSFVAKEGEDLDIEGAAQNWESVLGINVNVVYEDEAGYDAAFSGGDYSVLAYDYTSSSNDPADYFNLFTSGGIAWSFSSSLYDGFVADAGSASDGITKDSLLLAAEQVLFDADGFPAAPVCSG